MRSRLPTWYACCLLLRVFPNDPAGAEGLKQALARPWEHT
jgi:hypothetical protein